MAYSTPGQTRERVYRFVRERLLAGFPPTVREVKAAMGFRAVESARSHLQALVAEGRLVKERGKSRAYRLRERLKGEAPSFFVPLLGQIPAGPLAFAFEDPEGYLAVSSRLPQGELFALRVKGDSMTGAGILDGDLVIIRKQPRAEPGDIVAARVEDEATIKRLVRKRGRYELHPENSRFHPIVPEPGTMAILGKVIEVRRILT